MGRAKLLLPYRGGTVLGALAATLEAAGAAPIAIVAAAEDATLRAWCSTRQAAGDATRLVLALNPAPERGMLSSVLEGLAALGGAGALAERGATLLVCPGDLPALRPDTVVAVLARRQTAGAALAVPTCQGRRGHPLAIAPPLLAEIGALDPDRGLHQLLDLHAGDLLEVAVDDPGCITDVDTPEDYRQLVAPAIR